VVCQLDGLSVTIVRCPSKTVELIKMLLELWTEVGQKNLANMLELSMCSGDVAFCQFNLTIY